MGFFMKSVWLVPMMCVGVLSVVALNGCAGFRTDMQQGQDLSAAKLQSIHIGMSRQAVLDTLGEPMLENPYDPYHMNYVYTMLPAHGKPYKKQLILTMKQGQVTNVATLGY
jgi:outer membrane protein assembly factor BamE (lipoprotein component of BamABCDE complex)